MGKIEEAIKQSEFKDNYNKVVVNLLYTHSYLLSFQTAVLKPMNLSPEQYNVLRILRGQQGKPATIAAIQERMLNNMSNASRLVDKLKAKELVKRDFNKISFEKKKVDFKKNPSAGKVHLFPRINHNGKLILDYTYFQLGIPFNSSINLNCLTALNANPITSIAGVGVYAIWLIPNHSSFSAYCGSIVI
jgi:hypothetical protein